MTQTSIPSLQKFDIDCALLEYNQSHSPQFPSSYMDMIHRNPTLPTAGTVTRTLRDLLTVRTEADVAEKRRQLCQMLYDQDSIPALLPQRGPTTVEDHEEYEIDLIYQSTSRVWLYRAASPNGRLVIVHGGHANHGPTHPDLVPIRQTLLAAGYDVCVISMPGLGPNTAPGPQGDYNGGNGPLAWHQNLPFVDRKWLNGESWGTWTIPVSGLHVFFAPVSVMLNQVASSYDFVAMTGLSGGAWTANWSAAVDTRIQALYAVSGAGVPRVAHYKTLTDFGDAENQVRSLLDIVDHEDMQLMTCSSGRRTMHILNDQDSCCFATVPMPEVYVPGTGTTPARPDPTNISSYVDGIAYEAARLGGRWDYYVDSNTQHSWSSNVQNIIVSDLKRG